MKIEHIAMYVNNLEEARDFFVTYLGSKSNDGYQNKNTDFRSYFISFDDGARLELDSVHTIDNIGETDIMESWRLHRSSMRR